jgi:multicomponent Na+:H+ antiporter subunit D
MLEQLPVLIVVIPLMMAPLCLLLPRLLSWWIAAAGSAFSCAASVMVAFTVKQSSVMHYYMGGWVPPIGIAYRADTLTAYLLVIVSGIAMLSIPFAYRTIPKEVGEEKQPLFYAMYLLCLSGMLGIVVTNDIFNMYVFLEITSLATYTLIGSASNERRALVASFEYLVLGTIGATFFLIGIGLLYMETGTLNISDLASRLSQVAHIRPVEAAFAFITLGLILKIAAAPVHVWLTNAYAYSPTFVASFLSGTATKVSCYVLIRLLYQLFGWGFSFSGMPLGTILLFLGAGGILLGSMAAIYEPNIRRRLAFSSVAQIGYVLLALGLSTQSGLTFAVLQLFTHALTKTALFIAAGALFYRMGIVQLADLKGAGRQMPLTMTGFMIAGFGLIGIPGTAGFVAKWYFLSALVEHGNWVLVAVVLAATLMALVYVWQIIDAAFLQPAPANGVLDDAPLSQLASLWALVVLSIVFGFHTAFSLDFAKAVAKTLLLGGGAG